MVTGVVGCWHEGWRWTGFYRLVVVTDGVGCWHGCWRGFGHTWLVVLGDRLVYYWVQFTGFYGNFCEGWFGWFWVDVKGGVGGDIGVVGVWVYEVWVGIWDWFQVQAQLSSQVRVWVLLAFLFWFKVCFTCLFLKHILYLLDPASFWSCFLS